MAYGRFRFQVAYGRLKFKETRLIAFEDVAGVDFGLDVVETGVVAISYYGVALGFEG
jgi:hypothetical protein